MSARYCARMCSGSDSTGLCKSPCDFFIPDVTMEKSYIPPQQTVPTEAEEQEALFSWCLANGIDMVHIPNERKCTAYVAGQLLRQGMRKGFPDNFIPIARGGFHGLFIELKRAKKSLSKKSPEQREWVKKLNASGYKAVFCYGAEETKKVISEYLSTLESNATLACDGGKRACMRENVLGR